MSLFQRLVDFAERIRDEFNSWKQLLGQANGIATLGADGILAASQRPPGGGSVPNASETEAGIIEAATTNEAYNSTDILAITPEVLREFIETLIIAGFTQDTITGDGVTTTFNKFFTIPAYSNLVVAQIKNSATNIVVGDSDVSVRINGDGSIDVIFTTAPANGDEYTVVALTRAL